MQKPVEKAGAIILVLLITGCTSNSTKPTQASPPDAQDQRQEEQRKQDRQQHEMERGELPRPAPMRAGLPLQNYDASFSLLGTSKT